MGTTALLAPAIDRIEDSGLRVGCQRLFTKFASLVLLPKLSSLTKPVMLVTVLVPVDGTRGCGESCHQSILLVLHREADTSKGMLSVKI